MTGIGMIGIVLWSDSSKNRAVIWCEDHGDLAFYKPSASDCGCLHRGDCVTFTLEHSGEMRQAKNLVVLEEESHPALAACLAETGLTDAKAKQFGVRFDHFEPLRKVCATQPAPARVPEGGKMGQVIPFPARANEQRKSAPSDRSKPGKVVFL